MKLPVDAYVNRRNHITLELVGGVASMPGAGGVAPRPEADVAQHPEGFAATQPPDAAYVQKQIAAGEFPVHPGRCCITNKNIQIRMATIR